MHQLLKDSPARREDYVKAVGEDSPMPLKFCPTRWVENRPVLERALEVLPNMATYVKAVQERKYPNPGTKSFEVVKEATQDKLMPAKLNFVLSVSKEVVPFLTRYQTDKPMVPFLSTDLYRLLRSIMARFIKPDVMQNVKSVNKLLDVKVDQTSDHLSHSKIDVGFVAEKLTTELSAKKKVGEQSLMAFKMDSKKCLLAIVQKLLLKSPLNYSLVSNLSFLDPRKMLSATKELSIRRLKRALSYLVDQNRVRETDCDDIIREYSQFVDDVVESNHSTFADFDPVNNRVDTLLHGFLLKKKEFGKLWLVCRQLLLLSHGRAAVERGFSVNRQLEVENMKDGTYVAQRRICDHVRAIGGIEKVIIDKSLILSVSAARQRYHANQDDQKEQEKQKALAQKRKALIDEIEDLKAKKKRLQADCEAMEKSADQMALQAESKGKLTLIAKSNSFRRTAKQKAENIKEVDCLLDRKLTELKNK